jgi:hypothetical protein
MGPLHLSELSPILTLYVVPGGSPLFISKLLKYFNENEILILSKTSFALSIKILNVERARLGTPSPPQTYIISTSGIQHPISCI